MILLDANVLLYAYNADAPQHAAAVQWLEATMNGADSVGLPWITIWAFLRLSTNARVWPNPKSTEEAFAIIHSWLDHPGVTVVEAGPRHLTLLKKLITAAKASGPLVTDATLAALSTEQGAVLASTDLDFSRFEGLRWFNPLES